MKLSRRTKTSVLLLLNFGIGLSGLAWAAANLRADPINLEESSQNQVLDPNLLTRSSSSAEAVTAHPLFTPTRKPAPPDPAAGDKDAPITAPPPTLVGTMRGADGKLGALMEDAQSGTRKFLRLGDAFQGWTLKSLTSKKAHLLSGSQESEVQLSFDSRTARNPSTPSSVVGTP